MKLTVFVGPKSSGKDTCASIIQEMGAGPTIKFAGPLKDICTDVFQIPRRAFEDAAAKEQYGEYTIDPRAIGEIVQIMDWYIPLSYKEQRDALRSFANHVGTVLNTPRQVLQYVGTEMIRAVDFDWHCKAAFTTVDWRFGDSGVVTDCRFLNEYEYLVAHHAPEFYYVERPLAEAQLTAATHTSELEILRVREKITNVIHNTGTKEDLTTLVQSIFKGGV